MQISTNVDLLWRTDATINKGGEGGTKNGKFSGLVQSGFRRKRAAALRLLVEVAARLVRGAYGCQ